MNPHDASQWLGSEPRFENQSGLTRALHTRSAGLGNPAFRPERTRLVGRVPHAVGCQPSNSRVKSAGPGTRIAFRE